MFVAMTAVPVDLAPPSAPGPKRSRKSEVEVANGEFKLTRDLVAGENALR